MVVSIHPSLRRGKLKVLVVSPPMPKRLNGYRWLVREHNCSQVRGDATNPCLALSIINSVLETDVADVKFCDLQLELMSKKRFVEELNTYKPDIVITLLSIYAMCQDRWYAELHDPTIAVITPTTVRPTEAINKYNLNSKFFTVGDTTENTIHDAIKELYSKGHISNVKGLVVNSKDGLCYGGDYSDRRMVNPPFRADEVISMNQYINRQRRKKMIYLYTSKGCHYRCIYCTVGGREFKYIGNTAGQILDYITYLVDRYGVRHFLFNDADFIGDYDRAVTFAKGLVASGLNISYSINCTINGLSKELIDLLRDSGASELRIGIETVNKTLLSYLRKGYDIKKANDVVKYAIDKKINVLLYFTVGIPGETKSDIMENIDFLLSTGASKFTNGSLFPVPSTSFYNLLESEKKLIDKDWSEYYLSKSLNFINESYKSMYRIKIIQWWMKVMYRIQKTFGKCEIGTFKYNVYDALAEAVAPILIVAYNMYRHLYYMIKKFRTSFSLYSTN